MFEFFSSYKDLTGYLHRFTLLKVGCLHIRLHRILSTDGTPFQHTHPFAYASLILFGGYCEKVGNRYLQHGMCSLILRGSATPHQIVSVKPGTLTLFITWNRKDHLWRLERTGDTPSGWIEPATGVYRRFLYGREVFSKFDGFWHRSAVSVELAMNEHLPSIDQTTSGQLV